MSKYIDEQGNLSDLSAVELRDMSDKVAECREKQDAGITHEFIFEDKYDAEKAFKFLKSEGYAAEFVERDTFVRLFGCMAKLYYVGVPFETLKIK